MIEYSSNKHIRIQQRNKGVSIEQEEDFLGIQTNTVVYPRAMVVHQDNTPLAVITVEYIRRLKRFTD